MSVKPPQVHEKKLAELAAANAGSQDLLSYCYSVLSEYATLYQGIAKHSEQKGNDACWENDLELWRLIDDSVQYPHEEVPPCEEFLSNCRAYHEKISKRT